MTRSLSTRMRERLRKIGRALTLAPLFAMMAPKKRRDAGYVCTVRRRGSDGSFITEKWPPPEYGVKRDERGKLLP